MKTISIARLVSDDLGDLIQHSLKPITSDRFTLSIYFGKNLAKRYDRLSAELYKLFQCPLLRADFRHLDEEWQLHAIRPIADNEIPKEHQYFVMQVADEFFSAKRFQIHKRSIPRYYMAILMKPDDEHPPSNGKAIQKFIKAAKRLISGRKLLKRMITAELPSLMPCLSGKPRR